MMYMTKKGVKGIFSLLSGYYLLDNNFSGLKFSNTFCKNLGLQTNESSKFINS